MAHLWSELRTDLLELIVTSEALTIQDVSSFASVCRSWRSAAATAKHRRGARRQSPWLIYQEKNDPNFVKVYDLSKSSSSTISNSHNFSLANWLFLGSAHGWLIAADENSDLSLFNPVIQQQIHLPPASTFSFPDYLRGAPKIKLRDYIYDKATLSDQGDNLVVVYSESQSCLAFAKPGDKKWSTVNYPRKLQMTDFAFHENGKLYTVSNHGIVHSWEFYKEDSPSLEPELVVSNRWELNTAMCFYYLVRFPMAELLLVRRERTLGEDEDDGEAPLAEYMQTVKIMVWRIDTDGSKSNKLVLSTLGDHAIFLGGNMSICLSSKDYPELRRNCAYLTDEFKEYTHFNDGENWRDVGIFNLEDGSFEHILPNNQRLDWLSPIWLTPSLA